MSRMGVVVAAAAAAVSCALTGCTALMPDWPKAKPPTPAPETLQFQSVPMGADVRDAQGRTCQTPCSLTLPIESQTVTFTKTGFLPHTVQINIEQPPAERSFFSKKPPPVLVPNPVRVVLEVAPPPPEPAPPPKPLQPADHFWPASRPMKPQPDPSPSSQ
jgi:hypothetical protein